MIVTYSQEELIELIADRLREDDGVAVAEVAGMVLDREILYLGDSLFTVNTDS